MDEARYVYREARKEEGAIIWEAGFGQLSVVQPTIDHHSSIRIQSKPKSRTTKQK
jgi:hypothetical protein